MTCFEKEPTESTMEKTIEEYQKEIKSLQNELQCYKKNGDIQSDVLKRQWDILDKILFELPVGNITTHTYENIPERIADLVKENAKCEKEATDASLATWVTEESLESLERAIKTHYEYYSGFAANKNLSSFQMLDTLFKSNLMYNHVDIKENECNQYKTALEEIVKRPRKSETCKLIAQQALGLLNDDEYQPELLIEENLALKMKIEDLQAVIDSKLLNKVFTDKVNPLICCPDCGEYRDYHHEEHCKANL
jgi:hypothetical protein